MIAQLTAATDEQFYQMQKMSMPRLLADTSKLNQVINGNPILSQKTYSSRCENSPLFLTLSPFNTARSGKLRCHLLFLTNWV